MKKILILSAALLFTATMAMSQQRGTQTPNKPSKEKVNTTEASQHGKSVSETARRTRSGEAVSEQARTKGQSKRADKLNKKEQKRQERVERHERKNRNESFGRRYFSFFYRK